MPGLPLDPSAPPTAKMKSFISSSADSGCGAEKLPGGHCADTSCVSKKIRAAGFYFSAHVLILMSGNIALWLWSV